ncbi:signal peptidase I [Nostoc sp. TCL240-02]|uniref:signal peptidase I n=1 Tax=Nostoc sp. TCL240-02 TaxID=2572090 RepID=UPI00157FAFFF|nr:signal peptidase I [Nostoc sp. TCL240-02]QKQ77502.1 signal peptidase I [Nostoc sp. TCL240-02]
MKLSGDDCQKLVKAMLQAYPSKSDLEQIVRFELSESLDEIAAGQTTREIIFNLITWAEARGKLKILLEAICQDRPENFELQKTAEELLKKLNPLTKKSHKQQLNDREQLIENVNSELIARFQYSLDSINPINLRKEEQPLQVKRTYYVEIKGANLSNHSLSPNIDILDIFNEERVNGRLLILGNPGSGKTTTLLDLARKLLTLAKENEQNLIPVIFNLADWKPETQDINIFISILQKRFQFIPWFKLSKIQEDINIQDWLIEQLQQKYLVPRKIGVEFLKTTNNLVFLLDGLDELELKRQEKCILALNQFFSINNRGVICCRQEEYESYHQKLTLNSAVSLQELTNQQIENYLAELNFEFLWQDIQGDDSLLALAKSPLLLRMIALAYRNISFADWRRCETSQARLNYLFDAYTERMLNRDLGKRWQYKSYSQRQTKEYLAFLAQILKQEARTEFLIENIQPNWLINENQKKIYSLGLYLTQGAFVGTFLGCIINGIIFVLFKQQNFLATTISIIVGIIFALSTYFNYQEVKVASPIKFSLKGIIDHTILVTLIFLGVFGYLMDGWLGLRNTVIIGAISCIAFYTFTSEAQITSTGMQTANQGIYQSLKNSILVFIITCFLYTLLWVFLGNNYNMMGYVVTSLSLGIFAADCFGLYAVIKHSLLRLILSQGGYIPYNYARFLDYATTRLFLQRIGGRYRFMHDLLREYFAGNWSNNKCLYTLNQHTQPIQKIIIDSNGDFFVSASYDGTIKVWDLATGKLCYNLTKQHLMDNPDDTGLTRIAISFQLQQLISCRNDGIINIRDLNSLELIYSFPKYSDCIWRVATSSNGRILAVGAEDGKIFIYNLAQRELIHTLSGHNKAITFLAFSPDGSLLISGYLSGINIKIWDITTGKLKYTLRGNLGRSILQTLRPWLNKISISRSGTIYAVTFTPDGDTLITGSAGNGIEFWHPETRQKLKQLIGQSNWINSLVVSPDGEMLAGGTGEGAIELWHIKTGKLLASLQGHTDSVESLMFSPDGQRLVSGSDDKTIRIWQIAPIAEQITISSTIKTQSSSIPWAKIIPFLMVILTAIYVFFIVFFTPVILESDPVGAMSPTFQYDELIITDRLSYKFKPPQRGDVVIFNETPGMIKNGHHSYGEFYRRVLGLPRELVRVKDGKVYIDNKELKTFKIAKDRKEFIKLPKNTYMVIADNPNYNSSEPSLITVDQDYIKGRVIYCLFPCQHFEEIK